MQNQNSTTTVDNNEQQQLQLEEPVNYGYLNGSYTMGVDDPQTLQDKADAEAASIPSVSSEELASIASKLGVDVNALAGLLGVGQPQQEQPVEAAAEEKPETPEKEPEDDKQLRERLLTVDKEVKELLGVGLHDVYGLLQDLQNFKAQYVLEQQTNVLKQEWGDDYQDTLQEVKGYWEKLPDAQKKALDNVEGARLIHALLMNEKRAAPARQNSASSQYIRQGSVRPRSGATAKYRMSELVKLSEAEYARIQPQLEAAFRSGQVINDIR